MREILFRGKTEKGEWVEGFYTLYANSRGVHPCILTGTDHGCVIPEFVLPETAGQYIGLTDKNGKKIFEGDIVNEYDMPEKISNTGIVKWSNMFMGWHISQTRSMYCHEYMSYEVIGNIHDNPELLEAKQ